MDPTYTDQLETIVARLPEGSCAVGLITAPDADWALAVAGDLAATASRSRPGHTILVSLASDRPDLDHELGAESELGLSDVLRGAASMKSVAARSRGRGYIYLPQGPEPLSGRPVLESRAWRRIRDSALARGATLLILLRPDFMALDVDLGLAGLVLLGVSSDAVASGRGQSPPMVFGALRPPVASAPSSPAIARPASSRRRRRPGPARSSTMPKVRRRGSVRARQGQNAVAHESDRRLRTSLIAVFVIAALLVLIALVAAAATGAGDRVPFLRENDSLWQMPVSPPAAADSTGGTDSTPVTDSTAASLGRT